MPRAYSADIRGRVIARVESGASRREAAEQFEISPSAAVKWVKCFRDTGCCAAKPPGGSTSPLEECADWLLTLVSKRPDLTLDEVVSAMHKHGIPGSQRSPQLLQACRLCVKSTGIRSRRHGFPAGTRGSYLPRLDCRKSLPSIIRHSFGVPSQQITTSWASSILPVAEALVAPTKK